MAGKLQPRAEAQAAQAQGNVTPQRAIQTIIVQYRPVIAKLLADTNVSEETFIAQIANACRAVPDLWKCTPTSMLGAALRCAQLNLAPNDGRNLAWIVPYKNEATFQLGYGGIMELARRAVPGLKFDGQAVYPNDQFDLDYGAEQILHHRPAVVRQMSRGGAAYAWWVRARYPDGFVHVELLDRDQVEYHRGFSKQPDGQMWTDSYDAAALKSAVIDMKRWLPATPQLAAALASDEEVLDVEDLGPIDHVPADEPPKRKRQAKPKEVEAAEPSDADLADAEWIDAAKAEPTDTTESEAP